MNTTLNTTEPAELKRLDEFIAEIDEAANPASDLLREHLESARICLLGSMPVEYWCDLKLAREWLNRIPDKDLRGRLEQFLHQQLAHRVSFFAG
jgi:hypothetical protein